MAEKTGIYRIQVNTFGDPDGVWSGNAMRYNTAAEAESAARDLFLRWTSVESWRVVHNEKGGEVVDVEGP